MARLCNMLVATAAALLPHLPASAAQFWVPIDDSTHWRFLASGSWLDSSGASGSHGPEPFDVTFAAVDLHIGDHHAALYSSSGWYLDATPNGYFRVYEDDPVDPGWYRYFDDPEPFMTQDALALGASVSYSGARSGQWGVPGGGYERWAGTWAVTFTNGGADTVSTPLGTFLATRLEVASVDTLLSRDLFPLATGGGTWNEVRWFVDGLGYVKIQGSGLSQTDFDGDGVVDRWQFEELTYLAMPVPEPASAALLASGLLVLVGASCRRARARRDQAAGCSA